MQQEFEKEVITRLAKIETKLDDYKEIKTDAKNALTLAQKNKEDIEEIKENNTWLARTVFGSIILWLLDLFFKFK